MQVYPRLLETSRGEGTEESRVIEGVLRDAASALDERARRLEGALGCRPETRLALDEGTDDIDGIAMTIMDTAQETREPTLVAVGSRGLGAMQRIRVGSVSTKVVRAHPGPVLVCPRDVQPGTDETEKEGHRSSRHAGEGKGGNVDHAFGRYQTV